MQRLGREEENDRTSHHRHRGCHRRAAGARAVCHLYLSSIFTGAACREDGGCMEVHGNAHVPLLCLTFAPHSCEGGTPPHVSHGLHREYARVGREDPSAQGAAQQRKAGAKRVCTFVAHAHAHVHMQHSHETSARSRCEDPLHVIETRQTWRMAPAESRCEDPAAALDRARGQPEGTTRGVPGGARGIHVPQN